tara:strand:+ start:122 stop:697 length:576 start_codon:yes stop_codon:yes gene_type:complete
MIYHQKIAKPSTCNEWITHFDDVLEEGRIGEQQINEQVRRSNVKFITRQDSATDVVVHGIFQLIEYHVFQVNTQFGLDLFSADSFQFSKYDSDVEATYDWHTDSDFLDGQPSTRKLSLTILLNEGFKGGDFYIKTGESIHLLNDEIDKEEKVNLSCGDVLIFPSFLKHKVAPVFEGVRYSIVSWIMGPKWR